MKLNPAQLAAGVARQLAPIYVVGGDEPLLIEEALDAIRAAARAQGFSERQVLHVERGFDWSLAVEAATAMSLFGDRRIVELRMPTGNPGTDGTEVLRRLAAQASGDVIVIVVCGPLDRRQRSSGWYTAIEQAGASVHAWPVDSGEVPGWLESRLRAHGLRADADALQLLVERTEGNLLAAAQDVRKLALLFPDGRLDAARVRGAVADSARYDAFDLAEYLLLGDGPGLVRAYRHLLDEGADVVELLGALLWTVRQWAQAQVVYAESGDASAACDRARIPRPRQAAMRRALTRSKVVQVYASLRRLAQIDQLAKSTGMRERAQEELLTWLLAAGAVPTAGSRPPARAST